jgi:hypothetical protein
MKIKIDIEGATREQLIKYTEILTVLLDKGALDGVKAGQTILHFDGQGVFQGVELAYWPWRRRGREERTQNSYSYDGRPG